MKIENWKNYKSERDSLSKKKVRNFKLQLRPLVKLFKNKIILFLKEKYVSVNIYFQFFGSIY